MGVGHTVAAEGELADEVVERCGLGTDTLDGVPSTGGDLLTQVEQTAV
jgi:hypothetical protein